MLLLCSTHAPHTMLLACSFFAPCMLLYCSTHAPFALCMLLPVIDSCMLLSFALPPSSFSLSCLPGHSHIGQSDQRSTAASTSVLRKPSHNMSHRDFQRRSLSPECPSPLQRALPSDKASSSSRRPYFQAGTGGRVYSACAVCLGRHPHKVIDCAATMLWDNTLPALATHSNKVLVMQDRRALCADWQCASGCPTSHHDNRHICSGCASTSHGAQECPRAQKSSGSNTL